MTKRNRGKALRKLPARGRGKCLLCERTGVKLLYNYETKTEEMLKVCKHCKKK